MFPTIAAASKTLSKCMVLSAVLRIFSFSLASTFEALSVKDIQMSDEGTLVYCALPDRVKLNLFKNYQATFKKEYSTADEEIARYAIFKQYLKEADTLNAEERADNGTAVFGITVFADMSPQEFQSQYLGAHMPDESERKLIETKSVVAYTGTNTVADWRSTQTTPIKDQGGCGSCWAFSAVAQIESDSILSGLLNTESVLSTQQLVKCTYSRDGCNGGFTATAFDYVKNAGGITFSDFYPYNISTATCDKTKKDYTVTVTNWHRLADEQAMINYVLAKGTLSVVVDATLWGTYQTGIFTNCGSTLNINHAVNIVGVNVDEGYWIIRNSWGTWWGDKGYMKLALGRNMCGIANYATYTDVAPAPSSPTPRYLPTQRPTSRPTSVPTRKPTPLPTKVPTGFPSFKPTFIPTVTPTFKPTPIPTVKPSLAPSSKPTVKPTSVPSISFTPTVKPTLRPTFRPSISMDPTCSPTPVPTVSPSISLPPTDSPTPQPTSTPTTEVPSSSPTESPTETQPTSTPTDKARLPLAKEIDLQSLAVASKGSTTTSSSVASACGVVAAFVAMIVAAVLVCLYWKKFSPANKFSVHMLTEPTVDTLGDDIPGGDAINRPTSPTQSLQSI